MGIPVMFDRYGFFMILAGVAVLKGLAIYFHIGH